MYLPWHKFLSERKKRVPQWNDWAESLWTVICRALVGCIARKRQILHFSNYTLLSATENLSCEPNEACWQKEVEMNVGDGEAEVAPGLIAKGRL